ncbi:Glutaredoxin domain-containing cysteine-rich protein [Armadillidium nasatum]|uniref:Glutaredoxin domain-containing cysteine-rich protein n=1 Tax=Armadillidium nasatum TaxID=96803 RepID=A0A5N5SV72_9CRUS|nr:Glutaredoxin domain-containing cysteine-rich protein [Armadillidium nasatum]
MCMYAEKERGKVVIYVTTLGVVRETYERCLRLRKILWTLLVRFDERDVFMSRDTQIQLLDRLHVKTVNVPHVFLEGQYLGRPASTTPCDTCGGFRLLPCTVCRGSKKSVHRNNFTLEFVALKCSACDESGLVPCDDC